MSWCERCPLPDMQPRGAEPRTARRLGAAALVLLAALLPAPAAGEILIGRTNAWTVAEGVSWTNETWMTAPQIRLAGTCTDDVYASAVTAELAGTFEEDLWLVCRDTATFTGRAMDQVRIAAPTLQLSGQHLRSCLGAGYAVTAGPESRFSADLILLGDTVLFSGHARGDVVLAGSRATVQGHIEGDLFLLTYDGSVLPGTRIDGNIYYVGEQDLALSSQVALGGQAQRIPVPWMAPAPSLPELARRAAYGLLTSLLAGLALMWFFPGFTGQSVRAVRRQPARALLVGSLAILFLPALLLVFAAVPPLRALCLLVLGYLGLLLYLSKIVASLAVGGWLLRRSGPQPLRRAVEAMACGLVVLYLLVSTPIVGQVVGLLYVMLGTGAMLGVAVSRPSSRWAADASAGHPDPGPPPPPLSEGPHNT